MSQSTEPSVCAILLTANRPAMARQAVECFRAQTYDPIRRTLLIFDSGSGSWYDGRTDCENEFHIDATGLAGLTVGELRNFANAGVGPRADIIVTWDSDDYSHPNRIAEQVALLQSSGADCVGYNEMLFWREPWQLETYERGERGAFPPLPQITGEAWLYRNPDPHYALGTSLAYWRKTWERKPFEATSQGEDLRFLAGLKVDSVTSLQATTGRYFQDTEGRVMQNITSEGPRMIARIHPGNTSTAYKPEAMQREAQKRNGMWKRVPEWDKYCDGIFRSA